MEPWGAGAACSRVVCVYRAGFVATMARAYVSDVNECCPRIEADAMSVHLLVPVTRPCSMGRYFPAGINAANRVTR